MEGGGGQSPDNACRQARISQPIGRDDERAPASWQRVLGAPAVLTVAWVLSIMQGMSDLAPDLARLSPKQRLALIEALWDSLDDAVLPLTDAQRAELDRRIAGFAEDREHSIPWEQVKAELREPH